MNYSYMICAFPYIYTDRYETNYYLTFAQEDENKVKHNPGITMTLI